MMQWRGFVSNDHPSEVLPLQWPEISGGSLTGTNHPAVQLGVSLEPLGASASPVEPSASQKILSARLLRALQSVEDGSRLRG